MSLQSTVATYCLLIMLSLPLMPIRVSKLVNQSNWVLDFHYSLKQLVFQMHISFDKAWSSINRIQNPDKKIRKKNIVTIEPDWSPHHKWSGKGRHVIRETIASSASMSMQVTGPFPFVSLNTNLTRDTTRIKFSNNLSSDMGHFISYFSSTIKFCVV